MTEIDFAILDFIADYIRCAFLDTLLPLITHLGDGGALAIAVSVVLMITKKYRRVGCTMALALLMCLVAGNLLLKPLVARPRPFIQRPVNLLIPPPSGYSFPSGHSFASFASATVLAERLRKTAPYVIILAFLIAFSRLYLYVHFPSDVLTGSLLGVGAGFASCALVKEKEETMHDTETTV